MVEAPGRLKMAKRRRVLPYPKCIVCGCRASRWDGGTCGAVVRDGKMQPGYVVWLCKRHDPHHKHFDLPDNLTAAIADLVALREKLQEVWKRTF